MALGLLKPGGHSVEIVGNGAEAVAAVRGGAFDLVLMDMNMPVMDGIEATRAIRTLDAPKGTVWIVEIKSSLADFRTDQKWMEYRLSCDALFFAVSPEFPIEVLPADAGLIIADAYGGTIAREAPEHRLPAPMRKAMTLSIARAAAARLHAAMDPEAGWALF